MSTCKTFALFAITFKKNSGTCKSFALFPTTFKPNLGTCYDYHISMLFQGTTGTTANFKNLTWFFANFLKKFCFAKNYLHECSKELHKLFAFSLGQ